VGGAAVRAVQQLCRPCRHARQAKHPSAESASQQSPGRKPWEWHAIKPALKGRHRFSSILESLCRPFRADLSSIPDPGFQSPLSRALPPWALLLRAFGATFIDLSLTRMPCRASARTFQTRSFTPGFVVARFQRWDLFSPRLKRMLYRAEAKSMRH
jgi:hypothetical protein